MDSNNSTSDSDATRSTPPPPLDADETGRQDHSHASDKLAYGTGSVHEPTWEVSTDFGCIGEAFADETIKAKVTLAPSPAPGSRAHSPGPLAWSEPGWAPGGFHFAPNVSESVAEDVKGFAGTTDVANGPASRKSSLGSADLHDPTEPGIDSSELVRKLCETPTIAVKPGRSKLAPTAAPFAPKSSSKSVTPTAPAVTDTPEASPSRPRPFPLEIITSASRARRAAAASASEDSPSSISSPMDPFTPAPISLEEASQFDEEGRLISHGAKYSIADEILQLQSTPISPVFGQGAPVGPYGSAYETTRHRYRTESEQAAFTHAIENWRSEQGGDVGSDGPDPVGQIAFPSTASPFPFPSERGRSLSLASALHAQSPLRPGLERSNTVAQLQSYFGPPSPAVYSAHARPERYRSSSQVFDYALSSPQELSRTPSYASLTGSFTSPYPPLAHPEPFNLTPDDALYIEARELFVESSCSSLVGAPTLQHLETMAAHFDQAMQTLNPLASLYGLSQDAANHLLADPASSGVNEVVLKVAAMRGRQQQMASVQRSAMGMPLPGPSPNNRKLNLYKTELCRSWEEKGSCRYGVKCQFAHGVHELREIARHPKFKSEICRTFWNQGSCPYGKRCCFIHAVPDANNSDAASIKSSAPSTRPVTPSRTQARMTSMAITGAPSRTFGPALSELIRTSGAAWSLQSSPTQKVKNNGGFGNDAYAESTLESSALFGLGLRERPGQAPPTYKEAPQSRLQRLAGLRAGPSSTSLSSLGSVSGNTAFGAPASFAAAPHARHDSAHSFFSSTSSVSSAAASSPLLARSGSTSSLSSVGGSPVLRRISKDWLASPTHSTSAAHLDWSAVEELALDEPPYSAGAMLAQRFPRHA